MQGPGEGMQGRVRGTGAGEGVQGSSGPPGPAEVCLELHLSHVLGSLLDWGCWEPRVSSPGQRRAGWRGWGCGMEEGVARAPGQTPPGGRSPALSGPSPKGRRTVRIQLLRERVRAGGPLRWVWLGCGDRKPGRWLAQG